MTTSRQYFGEAPWLSSLMLAAVLLLGTDVASADRLHRYTVTIDPALTTLDVRACFDGMPPEALYAESLDAALALDEVRIEGTGKPIQPAGSIRLKNVAENGCILYRANVSHPIKKHDRTGGKIRRVGGDLLSSAGIWLWRPESLAQDEDIEIAFVLPEGISVSAPWKVVSRSPERAVFRMGRTPQDWPVSVAFGRFKEQELRVAESRFDVVVLDGSPAPRIDELHRWIVDAAQTVTRVFGRFPQPRLQVVIAPGARGNEPTPAAYVTRGGGPAVHFFINQHRPIQEFLGDWTAVHELSHLLLPYVNSEDAWLSEGVATYYQNVLLVRAGRVLAADAWQRMVAGFERGRRNTRGMTLAQATENMFRGGTSFRVYWEGAALILMADVRLRELSEGKQSMDTALATLNECCAGSERAWSAQQVFAQLDALTGTDVFGALLEQHRASNDFPDLAPAYRALGIFPARDKIELLPEGAMLREAIMSPGTAAQTGRTGAKS
jgi:hypothetical protein